MQYFFIPGRLSDLSLAELKSVLGTIVKEDAPVNAQSKNFFIVKTNASEELMETVFHRLGGFIKFGVIVELEEDFLSQYIKDGSITYGVSSYSFDSYDEDLGKEATAVNSKIKKFYKEYGMRARYITPLKEALTSAQVMQNKILENGFELNLMRDKEGRIVAGLTSAVQDIESFVERDYERPVSDIKMGVLPPKLARIMVNLAEIDRGGTIWDPFCGSGTILLEALELGYHVIGSDLSEDAVESSGSNINWLAKKKNITNLKYNVFQHDITRFDKRLQSKLKHTDIDAIIFEPYMGPPQRRLLTPAKAEKLLTEVSLLYKPLFEFLENIKKDKLRVVSILPSYKTHSGWATLRYDSFISKRWIIQNKKSRYTDLHWSRSNSIIRRNILIADLNR